MKLLIVLMLLPVLVVAGSVYDDSDVLTVNALVDTTVWTGISFTGDALTLGWDVCDSFLPWGSPSRKPDTTDKYVDHTTEKWIVGGIVCDTTPHGVYQKDDSTWADYIVVDCDTTYVKQITKHWKPLLTVKLTPDELARLKELLD